MTDHDADPPLQRPAADRAGSDRFLTLAALGWSDDWAQHVPTGSTAQPGRIVRHDGGSVLVQAEGGSRHYPLLANNPSLAVGDWVLVSDDRVVDLIPRRSLLQRRDPSTGDAQPIAANVDIVGIVCGLDRSVKQGRIQRFTVLAWDAGASPLVILTKADLEPDPTEFIDRVREIDPMLDIATVSSTLGAGVDELLERAAGKTIALVGESGAGKSTLINALADRDLAATSPVRPGDHKGRHTTTARQLHPLGDGACLIDTPGVREVGIQTDIDTIDDGFADIAVLAADCRFNDCAHDQEPGCAVRAALTSGQLSSDRFGAWQHLRKEAAWAELRTDPAARRRSERAFHKMTRQALRAKRRDQP